MRYCVECRRERGTKSFELMGSGERRNICNDCMRILQIGLKHRMRAKFGFDDREDWDVPASHVEDLRWPNAWMRFERMETPYIHWLDGQVRRLRHRHAARASARRRRARSPEAERERMRRRYAENPEKFRERSRDWRRRNLKQIKEREKAYRKRMSDHRNAYQEQYRQRNAEAKREYARQYREKNREELNRKRRERYWREKLGGAHA